MSAKVRAGVCVVITFLLTWLTWILAGMVILWSKHHPDYYEVGVPLFEWLSESPASWRLFLFTAAGCVFFYSACRWIGCLRFRWKLPAGILIIIVYAGLFVGLVFGVSVYYTTVYIRYPLSPAANPAGDLLQSKISAMRSMVTQARWPRYPEDIGKVNAMHQRGELFCPMEYFSVLTNLVIRPGYVLDYVHVGADNGFPILYARQSSDEPYRTEQEYLDTLSQGEWQPGGDYLSDWSSAISLVDTEEAFLEYAALFLIGQQFYLFWHANYDDLEIIASRAKMEELLNHSEDVNFGVVLPVGYKLAARRLDVRPKVKMGPELVEVTLMTFSKWGGFKEVALHIGREYPNIVFKREEKTLIPYDCGICF